jgi:Ca-activated chloride channel family protein
MSKIHRGRRLAEIVARTLALILLVAVAARGEGPLTSADVVRFLGVGISESSILNEVKTRGFGETLDASREATLRQAGATETLIGALKRAAAGDLTPAPRPAANSSPVAGVSSGGHEASFPAVARTVRVPVCVLDPKGEPILGLRGEDFQVSEDGKRQKVTLFSGERRPLRIALALDVSGSMDNKIRQVEEALRHFVDLLEPADEIMVITFNDEVRVVQGFTSDRALLGKVLDGTEPFGGTALYDAAFVAIRRVAKEPAESKAVVLVSDGVDTASRTSFDEVREIARRSEVPVFSIGLDGGNPRRNFVEGHGQPGGRRPGGGGHGFPGGGRGMPGGGGGWGGGGGRGRAGAGGKAFDGKPLIELAEDTGGRAEILKGLEHYTPGSDDLPGGEVLRTAVESIAATLRHRYLLGYEPPEGKRNWRAIRVEVARPDASARARKGYYGGA